jgi:hypothetical protein
MWGGQWGDGRERDMDVDAHCVDACAQGCGSVCYALHC